MTSPSISNTPSSSTTIYTPTTASVSTSTPKPTPTPTIPVTSSPTFPFPKTYNFPPFFTLQPNTTTRQAQLTKWSALIQAYCAHHRIFRLPLTSTTATTSSSQSPPPIFYNPTINKRLADPDIRTVIDSMVADGRAEYPSPVDPKDAATGAGTNAGVLIWWRRPDEWGDMIAGWVDGTGQRGSVLTLWEIAEGEGTEGQEFHGMETDVLRRCLVGLVKRGKAQVFGQEDQLGVKFF